MKLESVQYCCDERSGFTGDADGIVESEPNIAVAPSSKDDPAVPTTPAARESQSRIHHGLPSMAERPLGKALSKKSKASNP